MFDEIFRDGVNGLKSLIGRVISILLSVGILYLVGVGITPPGFEPPDPTPEPPIVLPTATSDSAATATPSATATLEGGTIPLPTATAAQPDSPLDTGD